MQVIKSPVLNTKVPTKTPEPELKNYEQNEDDFTESFMSPEEEREYWEEFKEILSSIPKKNFNSHQSS